MVGGDAVSGLGLKRGRRQRDRDEERVLGSKDLGFMYLEF